VKQLLHSTKKNTFSNAGGSFPLPKSICQSKFICQHKTHFLHAKIDFGGGFRTAEGAAGPMPIPAGANGSEWE